MTHLTVNNMSERSGIDSKEIQRALFELHWVIKDNGELKINSPFEDKCFIHFSIKN